MPTLNTVFKQVFGEALEPLGFKKIKGKYPYFVRLIGNEIIHVISCCNESTGRPDKKAFNILGGVATVYRKKIELEINCKDNNFWLKKNSWFYSQSNCFDYDSDFSKSISEFCYKPDDDSMIKAINYSLKITKDIMLQILDEVIDIDSCLEYFNNFVSGFSVGYNESNDRFSGSCEGLIYFKTENYKNIIEKKEEREAAKTEHFIKIRNLAYKQYAQMSFEERCKKREEVKLNEITKIDDIVNNSNLFSRALNELEERKKENITILKSYGLNFNNKKEGTN